MQQQQPKDLKLLYPSKKLPEYLKPFVDSQNHNECNFITGYRSFLTVEKTWGLQKNQAQDFCTRAFAFPFKGSLEQLKSIIAEKSENKQQCQLVSTSIVITQKIDALKIEKIQAKQIELLAKGITREDIESQSFEEITINIFQNSFDTYYDYMESVGWYLQPRRLKQNQLNPAQKVAQEYNIKALVGEKMFSVPKYNPQTGNWDQVKENISLKLRKSEKQ